MWSSVDFSGISTRGLEERKLKLCFWSLRLGKENGALLLGIWVGGR